MRITLDLPEDLVEEARRVANVRTRREAVIAGLKELLRKGRREELRGLAGRLDLRLDLTRSRERKRT